MLAFLRRFLNLGKRSFTTRFNLCHTHSHFSTRSSFSSSFGGCYQDDEDQILPAVIPPKPFDFAAPEKLNSSVSLDSSGSTVRNITPLLCRKPKKCRLREVSVVPMGNNNHRVDFSFQEKKEIDFLYEDKSSSRDSASTLMRTVKKFPQPPSSIPVSIPPTSYMSNFTLGDRGLVNHGTAPSLAGYSQSQSVPQINGGKTRPSAHKSGVSSHRLAKETASFPTTLSPDAYQERLFRPRGTGKTGGIPVIRDSPSVGSSSHRGSDRTNVFINRDESMHSSFLNIPKRKPRNKLVKRRRPIPFEANKHKAVTSVGQTGPPTRKTSRSTPFPSPSLLGKERSNNTTTVIPVLSAVSTRTQRGASRPSPRRF